MTDETRHRNWLVPVLALVLLVGGWVLFRALFPPFAPPERPAENAYDDFRQAADMLAERTGFYREMRPAELKSVVEQNRPALALVREGLNKECQVALDWSGDRAWLDNVHMKNLDAMRALSRALAAAARQANRDGEIDYAVQCGLDTIHLANQCSQGGLLVDRMLAGGVHATALFSLQEQVSQLNKIDSMRLLKKLQITPLQLEPPEAILDREKAFFRRLNGTFQTLMMTGVIREQQHRSREQMEEFDRQHAVLEKLLQTHIALHAYQLDHDGQLPKKLDALAPNYLDRVPWDDFSGNPLLYQTTDTGYRLYSVGPDGVDDQGVEAIDGKTGDLLLEVSH